MISRYNGTCVHCSKPTKAGTDIYDVESKESYHEACRENPVPTPADFSKAAELGFVPSADIGSVSWVAVCADWVLRNLRQGVVRETTGRSGPESRGRNTNLFGEE